MTKLTASSGTVIHEEGNKLYISKSRASWTSTFLFVTGLLAFILLANGVLQLTAFKDQFGSSKIGIILILLAVVFIFIFWRISIYHKKARTTPQNELLTIAIADFEHNILLDGQQNILTPLDQAYLIRKMQLTSSSPELIIQWPRGSLSIVKGNPFSGGIAGIEKLLMSKGIRKR